MNDEEDQLKLQSVALQETSIVDPPTGTHDFVCWLRCRRHNWIRIKWLLSNKENFFFTLNLMPLKGVLYVVHKCCITTNMNVSFCPLSSSPRVEGLNSDAASVLGPGMDGFLDLTIVIWF